MLAALWCVGAPALFALGCSEEGGSAPPAAGGVPQVVAGASPIGGAVSGAGVGGSAAEPISAGTGGQAGSSGGVSGGSSGMAGGPSVVSGHGPGHVHEVSLVSAAPVEQGRFSLYIPSGIDQLLGVIVHQHGCGRAGFNVAWDLHWQSLANRWGLALMGTEFPTVFADGDHCDRWSHVENGSDALFLEALTAFADQTQHPELEQVPWALWGHSGGATWAFQMAKRHPERVLGVVLKSICEVDPAFEPALVHVPFLLATGAQDLAQCYPITTGIFASYREAGAPWSYVDEPEGTHETRQLRYLAIPYLDAMIERRLDPAQPSRLRVLLQPEAVLADNATHALTPAGEFAGDPAHTSYLPTMPVALAWRQLVETRQVVDTSAPAAPPRWLEAIATSTEVSLSWAVDADLESGVRAFQIYRDGTLWQRVPAGDAPFQGWNYGDEPEPVIPAMTAHDASPGTSYAISFVNGAGLESPQSEPVIPRPK